MDKSQEWVLDVTLDVPCFVLFDQKAGKLITGLNLIAAKCPGKFVGIYHADGWTAAARWCAANLDWRTRYAGESDNAVGMGLGPDACGIVGG